MLKTIAIPFISMMLIFSILAPSIAPLLDKDYDTFVFLDSNEEEKNNEKESEKNFDEKNLFLNYVLVTKRFFVQNKTLENVGYLFFNSDSKAEIFLPPPKLRFT
ncbi:MAG: hypothetical protein ABJN84_06155 [Flavobacteriaceae bacterium]